MGICKGVIFAKKDIYVNYPYENVMYRWDHKNETCHVKFYGEIELTDIISSDNELFNDAILYGEEISKEEYFEGKPLCI